MASRGGFRKANTISTLSTIRSRDSMSARPSARFPLRAAAIDVGSNGMRCMAVAYHASGDDEVLMQARAAVRLGHSVFSDGAIDEATMDAAVEALAGFRRELDGLHIEHVRAVATSAVREAANRQAFLRRARKEAGVDVEVISGSEEARLAHTAVARRERLVRNGSRTIGRRFLFDEAHGMHVAHLCLSLFDQTQGDHGLGDADRAILQAAAILHDVGRFVDDRKHHKHTYYLVSQSEVPGLSGQERELAAQVARYHRRKEPNLKHEPFARLAPEDQERVLRLSAILRVADALDSEHRQAIRGLTVKRKGDRTALVVQGDGDLGLEEWSLKQKGGLCARIFATGLELKLEAAP